MGDDVKLTFGKTDSKEFKMEADEFTAMNKRKKFEVKVISYWKHSATCDPENAKIETSNPTQGKLFKNVRYYL